MADAVIRIRLDDSELREREARAQVSRQRGAASALGYDYEKSSEGIDWVSELEQQKEDERRRKRNRAYGHTGTRGALRAIGAAGNIEGAPGAAIGAAKAGFLSRLNKIPGGRLAGAAYLGAQAAPAAIAGVQGAASGLTGVGAGQNYFTEGVSDALRGFTTGIEGRLSGAANAGQTALGLADLGIRATTEQADELGAQEGRVGIALSRQRGEFAEDRAAQIAKGLANSPQLALMVTSALRAIPTTELLSILDPILRQWFAQGGR